MSNVNTGSEFTNTRNLFRSYINYTCPLSYSEWLALPSDSKTAALYCQFYDQITLAWYKLKSVYSNEADGVAEVLQYLQKNVSKIEDNESKFSPNYIYRVMYNCLYCLCRDPNRYKKVYENECSNVTKCGEDELDLFDTVVDLHSEIPVADIDDRKLKFWNLIEDMGQDTVVVVAKLLNEDINFTTNKKITARQRKKISPEDEARILADLRKVLVDFVDIFM